MSPSEPERKELQDLLDDPLLRDAPIVEGFKVLDPAVLYAKIGRGGMGAVYRGRHFKLDLDVAVKCLKPALVAEDIDFVKRFEREARLAASIAHQNVVRVMDVHEKNGIHYLVMEFVRGETAAERVERKGPLAEKEALAILFGATAGLAPPCGTCSRRAAARACGTGTRQPQAERSRAVRPARQRGGVVRGCRRVQR